MSVTRAWNRPVVRLGVAIVVSAFVVGAAVSGSQDKPAPPAQGPGIERLDPALDRLIAPDAKIETLAEGYEWAEGPIWVKDGGYVLFSDVPKNTIHRWKQGEGAKPYLTPSGYTGSEPRGGETGSNGLTLDPSGRLVLAQHGDRRVARLERRSQTAEVHDARRSLRGQAIQQPQRSRLQVQRRPLLHRPALRAGEAEGRPEAGAAVQRRLPARPRTARSRC